MYFNPYTTKNLVDIIHFLTYNPDRLFGGRGFSMIWVVILVRWERISDDVQFAGSRLFGNPDEQA
jgi:hypothetical protein